jgi:hypothetical protein
LTMGTSSFNLRRSQVRQRGGDWSEPVLNTERAKKKYTHFKRCYLCITCIHFLAPAVLHTPPFLHSHPNFFFYLPHLQLSSQRKVLLDTKKYWGGGGKHLHPLHHHPVTLMSKDHTIPADCHACNSVTEQFSLATVLYTCIRDTPEPNLDRTTGSRPLCLPR